MKKILEYRACAAFCRQLSIYEPANRAYWLAEADRWSRLEQDEIAAFFAECNLIPSVGEADHEDSSAAAGV